MREFTFVPTTAGFTGTMTINVPTYSEKLGLMKELGLNFTKEGEINLAEVEERGYLSMMEIALSKVNGYIKDAKLKFGDKEINKDDLEYYEECMPLIMEVFMFLVKGLSLGKK